MVLKKIAAISLLAILLVFPVALAQADKKVVWDEDGLPRVVAEETQNPVKETEFDETEIPEIPLESELGILPPDSMDEFPEDALGEAPEVPFGMDDDDLLAGFEDESIEDELETMMESLDETEEDDFAEIPEIESAEEDGIAAAVKIPAKDAGEKIAKAKAAEPKLKLKIIKFSEGRNAAGYVLPGMEFWLGRMSSQVSLVGDLRQAMRGSVERGPWGGFTGQGSKLYQRILSFIALLAGTGLIIFLVGLGERLVVRRR